MAEAAPKKTSAVWAVDLDHLKRLACTALRDMVDLKKPFEDRDNFEIAETFGVHVATIYRLRADQ